MMRAPKQNTDRAATIGRVSAPRIQSLAAQSFDQITFDLSQGNRHAREAGRLADALKTDAIDLCPNVAPAMMDSLRTRGFRRPSDDNNCIDSRR
ncbi:MAG: hypothetical protein VX107_16565, partial [Pseudomonadota bacterium]|nr:hypothetical protein [Pseudomonadota bacterium]